MTHLLLPPRPPPPSVVDAAHASGHGSYNHGPPYPYNQLEKYKKEDDEINGVCVQLDWTSNTSRQKNNLPMNQKGYDKENPDLLGIFFCDHF